MLSRLGISARIFAGFGAIILLLGIVVAASLFGVRSIADTSREFGLASEQTIQISGYVEDFNALKFAMLEYQANPSSDTAAEVDAWVDKVATNSGQHLDLFENQTAALEILEIAEVTAQALQGSFNMLAELEAERVTLVEGVVNAEVQFRDRLNTMLEAARGEGNADFAIEIGLASQRAMLMQQASTKYIQSKDAADYEVAMGYGAEAIASFDALSAGAPASLGSALFIATELVKSYLDIVGQVHENDLMQIDVSEVEIDIFADGLDYSYEELFALVLERQQNLLPQTEAATTTTNLLVIGMGAAALIIGVVCSFLIGRWLSRAIGQMSASMARLAEGDLDIELAGAEQKNELGMMARALEVFRKNGRAVLATEAEKAREAEADKIEQQAHNAMQADVSRVVAAAAAGDFTARAVENYEFEELNDTARSLNNLMETVDKGISEAGDVLAALAHTDLTRRVTGTYEGTFEKLKEDTNAVAEKLTDVMSQLRVTSHGVKTATSEILMGANDLSERTTKQAATIEQTSAAMEQLANTLIASTKKAQEVSIDSQHVAETAEAGAKVMTQANEAMERITSSSAKISNIIGMIDDIAFQTNLLALNASVEAARAGEAGKGFAVVAVEVRRLAQSAADASSEVKQLIEHSSTEVDQGSKLVSSAVEKLETMRESVQKSSLMINAIAEESQQQSSAVEEVNTAVKQMDEMTQHNAALVEQTNAAIEKTEAQASDLDRIVEVFKVGEHVDEKTDNMDHEALKEAYLGEDNAA